MFQSRMVASQDDVTADAQRVRARRLLQISRMVMVALAVTALLYAGKGSWVVVGTLMLGVLTMAACQFLGRQGRTDQAILLLLGSMTVMTGALMWIAEGLHDVAMMTFPVILFIAGLLASRRLFFGLLGAMLAFLGALAVATYHFNLRADTVASSGLAVWRDATVILLLGAAAVWVLISDLQRLLARLTEEIGRHHESQVHLAYLARHDALTGLPNRSMGRDRIEQAIEHAGRHGNRIAMLFVDLDNFKAINDSLGHAIGDDFLKEVASRLVMAVRKSDVVSRHGGDEFVIGLTDVATVEDASTVATSILSRLTRPLVVKDMEVSATCSIGIAICPDDAADYETLLRCADIAMYQAKESGRNAMRFYDDAMQTDIQQNLLIVSGLRQALARREFELHYQPVVDLMNGRLIGAEALVRWRRPDVGLVLPGRFIDAAERSGLIVEMGEWVLGEACRQAAEWRAAGSGAFTMAVNLSVVQFRRGNVDEVVRQALQRSGLDPAGLELEITESTLVHDADHFMQSLQRIKALGVRISIDDFGTGYSNLSYLQRFAVDKLKIDQSFVARLGRSEQDRAIVHAIIQIARSLDLVTTAEGIEDEGVVQALIVMGCDQGQGYLFGRPEPALDFARRLPPVLQASG